VPGVQLEFGFRQKKAALTAVFEIFVVLDSGSYEQRDKNSRLFENGSFNLESAVESLRGERGA